MEKRWRRGGGGCHGDEYGVGEEDYELDEDEEMGKGLNVDVLEEVDNNLFIFCWVGDGEGIKMYLL